MVDDKSKDYFQRLEYILTRHVEAFYIGKVKTSIRRGW